MKIVSGQPIGRFYELVKMDSNAAQTFEGLHGEPLS